MKRFRPLILAVLIASPIVNAAGIPVFDATARLENIAQWTKEAQQWLQTVQHYKDQLQAYQNNWKQLQASVTFRRSLIRPKALKRTWINYVSQGKP